MLMPLWLVNPLLLFAHTSVIKPSMMISKSDRKMMLVTECQ
jgi:hypothetical protein